MGLAAAEQILFELDGRQFFHAFDPIANLLDRSVVDDDFDAGRAVESALEYFSQNLGQHTAELPKFFLVDQWEIVIRHDYHRASLPRRASRFAILSFAIEDNGV
jgi:hypothetical protein